MFCFTVSSTANSKHGFPLKGHFPPIFTYSCALEAPLRYFFVRQNSYLEINFIFPVYDHTKVYRNILGDSSFYGPGTHLSRCTFTHCNMICILAVVHTANCQPGLIMAMRGKCKPSIFILSRPWFCALNNLVFPRE